MIIIIITGAMSAIVSFDNNHNGCLPVTFAAKVLLCGNIDYNDVWYTSENIGSKVHIIIIIIYIIHNYNSWFMF